MIAFKVWADSEHTIGGKSAISHIIQDEGTSLRPRSYLNFTGAGITCSDTGGKTVCNATGGGGGGSSGTTTIKDNTVEVLSTSSPTLDLLLYADCTESPTDEANCTIPNFMNTTTNSATATAGRLLIGDGIFFNSVAMTGDATINSLGSLQLGTDTVGTNEIDFINSGTVTAGNLLVASGNDFHSVAMSGDATIGATGAVVVANNSHTHTASNISDQNAGTDITADLEEETHASEHQDTGADEVAVTGGMINSDLGDITCDGTATGCNIDTGVVSTGEIATDGVGAAEIAADAVGISEIDFINSATATSGRLLIADGAQFNSVAMAGDATLNSLGALQLGGAVVTTNELSLSISPVWTGDHDFGGGGIEIENNTTLPGSCTVGQIFMDTDATTGQRIYGCEGGSFVLQGDGGGGASGLVDLNDVNSATATAANILLASGGAWHSFAMSGDCTITAAGVIDCPGSGATTLTDLADVNSATATNGNMLIASGLNFHSMAMSGDATISSTGAITVADDSHAHVITNIDAFTEAELETQLSDVTAVFTNNVTGDVTVSGSTSIIGSSKITSAMIVDDTIVAADTAFLNSTTTTAGNLLIADGEGFNSFALSGDATINSAGAFQLGGAVVTTNELSLSIAPVWTGDHDFGGGGIEIENNTSLPGSCTVGQIFMDTDATAGQQIYGCEGGTFALQGDGGGGASALVDLTDVNSATAATGRILLADGSAWHSAVVGGDCTIAWNGTMSCTGGSGATTLVDLADVNSATATYGNILFADGSQFISGTMLDSIHLPPYSVKLTGSYVTDTPSAGEKPSQGAAIEGGDGAWKILFDATTDEAVVWQWKLPDDWTGHHSVIYPYSMASATTLEVEWECAIKCSGEDVNVDSVGGFVNDTNVVATVPGTAGFIDYATFDLSDANTGTCSSGNLIWFQSSTDADDATSDDATGDRELLSPIYRYFRKAR